MKRNKFFFTIEFRFICLILLAGLFCLFFPVPDSYGRDISFSWTANTDDPAVNGYYLFYKDSIEDGPLESYNCTDGQLPSPVKIEGQGTTEYTLTNLDDNKGYSFVLTAYRGDDRETGEESEPTGALYLQAVPPPTITLQAKLSTTKNQGDAPLTVNFDVNGSTGEISEYELTYGDGSQPDTYITAPSISEAEHTFTTEGTYTVTLKVTGNSNATDQVTVPITVTKPPETNNPPTARITSSSTTVGSAPLSVHLDGLQSTDTDGTILTYEWDFGDGGKASGASVNYTYNTAGTFTVRLTVTDNGGLTDSETLSGIMVSTTPVNDNALPTAVITSSVKKGYAPVTVSFNGEQSSDSDGRIESYAWSFGDGTTASGLSVTHKFLQPAAYKVTLKVKDNKNASSLPATFTVTVLSKDQQDDSDSDSGPDIKAVINYLLLSPSIHVLDVPEESDVPEE